MVIKAQYVNKTIIDLTREEEINGYSRNERIGQPN
jgi:hypothetical protein